MILTELNFGCGRSLEKGELEDIAETYIASLFHAGQLCGEYFLTWIKGHLICHVLMAGLCADKTRYHSDWGKSNLKKVIKAFGRTPVWTIRDDELPRRNIAWKAPTLHLLTHAFAWQPPLCRGDTGQSIPIFLLPLSFQGKDDLIRWQSEYQLHDRLWLNSGALEIAAYKELVDPNSGLSAEGRELCAEIEKATGVPTYYFLMRFYAPSQGADDRPCPGCGKPWHIPQPQGAPYQQWPFRCEPCRLVSTAGVDINKRLAKIGQWRPNSQKPRPRLKGARSSAA
jgi:predicted  nucleic acid-binding Zn ribbon protein